jgi:hypothetical protein
MSCRTEQLRQQRETFELAKRQAERWFCLRLRVGYGCLFLLEGIATLCGYIILNPTVYTADTARCALAVLGLDIAGQVIVILKVVLDGRR